MNARGFALIEWVIAAALVTAIAGAVFAVVVPARDVFTRTQQRSDLVIGARGALDLVVGEIREAGSGATVAPGASSLARVLAPFALMADIDSPAVQSPATAITIWRTLLTAAQGRLAVAARAGERMLALDTVARCASGAPACGFSRGDRALLFTSEAVARVTIDAVSVGVLTLVSPLPGDFAAGSTLVQARWTTFGVRQTGADYGLVRVSDGGAEQPVLDHVVAFQIEADDPNPAAARRVSLRLRVQTPAAHLRGPAGPLFVHAGTAPGPRQWIPDVELRADVALRNAERVP